MNNVISINRAREDKEVREYAAKIGSMESTSLLEEMIRYQEGRPKRRHTLSECQKAEYLFRALVGIASTAELKDFTESYLLHLVHEKQELLRTERTARANR